MNNDTNNLVNDLLNILQPDTPMEKTEKKPKPEKKEKVEVPVVKKPTKQAASMASDTEGFLSSINENVKNTQNAKVVIRKDLYEVFMLVKRAKQVKSVSTLLDHALEDYIKRNSDNIKQLLNDSKNHEIF